MSKDDFAPRSHGLVVRFFLWVEEVPGSNPGATRLIFFSFSRNRLRLRLRPVLLQEHRSRAQARSKFASAFVARHTPHVTGLESPAGGTTDVHSRKRTYIGTFLQIQYHLSSEYNRRDVIWKHIRQ